ncbi:MAG: DEAD/DEAH box helicase family protein [Collinsella sp.]|nr:DEAD/DEAH box helicase family protein [Collinsella sp.]
MNRRLRELLTEDEYAEARASTLTAFYTPESVARAMCGTLRGMGFGEPMSTDRVLEPGCGTGNFMAAADSSGLEAEFDGIEVDSVSARIAAVLHPQARIVNAPLEDCYVSSGSYDAVVGNVPYSDAITLPSLDGSSVIPIHDRFIQQAVESLRPGGVAVLLTSRYTLDKTNASTRRWIACRAELLGAVRMPSETFSSQAGTDAISDVLVLRRRPEVLAEVPENTPGTSWLQTTETMAPDGTTIPVNRWFAEHPKCVIGLMEPRMGRFGYTLSVRSGLQPEEIASRLADEMGRIAAEHADSHSLLGKRAEEPTCARIPNEQQLVYEYYLDEAGQLWFGNGEAVDPVVLAERDAMRMRAMVGLRDGLRDLLELERSSDDEEAVESAIGLLRARYEEFAERYGRVNDAKNLRLWEKRRDHSISFLRNVERTDARGRFIEVGDVLRRRVQAPSAAEPTSVSNASDALAISLDRTGGVDMDLICRLMGATPAEALESLGEAVILDPESGVPVTSEAYFSGDVLARAERLTNMIETELHGRSRAIREKLDEMSGLDAIEEAVLSAGAGELKKALNGIGGAWDAYCDPIGSETAVNVDAAVAALGNRSASWHLFRPSSFLPLLDDLRPGCRLTDAEGHPLGLWSECVKRIGRTYGSQGHTSPFLILRAAARADVGVVDAGAFRSLLTHSSLLDDGIVVKMLRSVLDEDSMPWLSGSLGQSSRRFVRIRERTREEVEGLADLLRADPDLLDYLAFSAARYDGIVGPGINQGDPICSTEELAAWRARRAELEALQTDEPDRAKVASLESLRDRLLAAAPAPLDPEEVAVNLGAPWIPPSVYYEFANETFDFSGAWHMSPSGPSAYAKWIVSRSTETGAWQVVRTGAPELTPAICAKYGTPEKNPLELMESAMNGARITVTMPDPHPPADKPDHRVPDPAATAAAYAARDRINAEFKRWCMADPDRAAMLCGIYNRRFNNLSPRTYSGSYLTLPGSNPSIALRPHQKDAVARVLQGDSGTLIAHVVGAGKTFASVASIMEARRIGKATKPLVVVPNHLTEQWASDFQLLYPGAKTLFMTRADLRDQSATRSFWARAALGDWDAVIVAQSRFDMLSLSADYKIRAHKERLDELVQSITAAKESGNRFSVKQLEQARARVKGQIDRLRERGHSTEGLTFEDMGFDFLLVDEAHGYKNLAVAGRSIAGMSSTPSAKCENLLDICDWMREQGHGSNIVFATGTPVSNTMSELYNMERYLAPDLLRSQGVYYFSDWAQNFGEAVQSVEMKPDGNGFQVRERFARFHNLPELMRGFHAFADIMTKDDIELDVPEVESVTVAVDADEQQRSLVKLLGARADLIRNGSVDPKVDNMLKITSEGRALALSPRLLEDAPDDEAEYGHEGGKLRACCENVFSVWSETGPELGTQLVFCDASTPAGGQWNVYGEIRAQLIAMGIPESEIAFVHDAKTPAARDALFERVNAGEVRVLLGSTQKLGTGTNVQKRLAAIHDVDCPWRPSDLEQRLGRIERQGNMYASVKDFRYVTTGTFDSYLYQTVERKQRFISQVFTNSSPARSGDDLDETVLDYATIKAVASGDPAVRKRLFAENRLSELELARKAFDKSVRIATDEAKLKYGPIVSELEARLSAVQEDHEAAAQICGRIEADKSGRPGTCVVVGGSSYSDRSQAAKALVQAALERRAPGDYEIGRFYDASLLLRIDRNLISTPVIRIGHTHVAPKPISLQTSGPETAVRQLERLVLSVRDEAPKIASRLEAARTALAQSEAAAARAWEFQEEYNELRASLSRPQRPSRPESLDRGSVGTAALRERASGAAAHHNPIAERAAEARTWKGHR